jgi:hypothetical protein
MNDYRPEPSDQYSPQPRKLVLPAYQDATSPASEDAKTTYIPMGQAASSPYDSPVRPEQLMQNYASSAYGKVKPRSRNSPAQLILLIAIIVVLIATGSVAYAAVSVVGPALTKSSSGTTQANKQASATALPTATPIPSPTATPKPISTFDGAPLKLTIEDLPHTVNNGDSGDVTVQTNATGIPVHLEVTYAAPPFKFTSNTQMTDDQGVATLTWNVQINPTKRKTNSLVVAIAQEPNGQTVKSDTVNVRIIR